MDYCKRLILSQNEETRNNVFLGIITGQDDFFLHFKTAKRKYSFPKSRVLSVEETDVPFVDQSGDAGAV